VPEVSSESYVHRATHLDTLHKKTCCIGPRLCIMLEVNFRELRKGEVRRIHHGRTSGSVKVHCWVTTLGQQGTEVQDGRSSTLVCMSQWNIHLLSAGFLLPILSSMIFTARTTPRSARIISPSSSARRRTPSSVTALLIARPSISAVSLL
jgi:hypothetical protein